MKKIRYCLCCQRRTGWIVRGLCGERCYPFLLSKIRRGETTWAELERSGKSLPAKQPGPISRANRAILIDGWLAELRAWDAL